MNRSNLSIRLFFIGFYIISKSLLAQIDEFDINEYQKYLDKNQNMESTQLLDMYPSGSFRSDFKLNWETTEYHQLIEDSLELTTYEKSLLNKHGFVVTERLKKSSFVEHFSDIWKKDLPVFISTDAILHAFHFNYVNILKKIEVGTLIDKLTYLLSEMHNNIPALAVKYALKPEMDQMLKDVDVYITVPLKLLGHNTLPTFGENTEIINEIIDLIYAEKFCTFPFFSEHCKEIDFSQFKPRGHYAEKKELSDYFRAMMWLGRIEVYLLAPEADTMSCPKQTASDIQRQTIDAVLLTELIDVKNLNKIYKEIEEILSFMANEQDNVTISNIKSLIKSVNISNAADLLDTLVLNKFQDTLRTKSYSTQKILSQILAHDPLSPKSVEPASAFMLFGQRFVIDSYIAGKVVYDRIIYNEKFPCRLFPSTLDILFALGNNASAQLLTNELDEYHYSSNLSALKYLIESYDSEFWNGSIHSMWLNSIRMLNPPVEKSFLPQFMQTAAWWQQKMNTQLSSWTELRHDHILYAKPSYTAAYACSYPSGYVEPFPEFFYNISSLAESINNKIENLSFSDNELKTEILDHFELFKSVTDTLGIIAQKEIDKIQLDSSEISFMKGVLYWHGYPIIDGWYLKLLNNVGVSFPKEFKDFLVADYHTTPTDCFGNIKGWVSHAGTGPVDLAIVTARTHDNQMKAYVGPVMSYYDYRTLNFLRLTDEEWENTYLENATRPDWVNIYLADISGKSKGSGSVLTSMHNNEYQQTLAAPKYHISQNYPNPFNSSTIINFSIPTNLVNSFIELTVYDIKGEVVKSLINAELPSGNYFVKWNGTNTSGNYVSSGVYFYRLKAGDPSAGSVQGFVETKKMLLLK